jgi:hypothetical protein
VSLNVSNDFTGQRYEEYIGTTHFEQTGQT